LNKKRVFNVFYFWNVFYFLLCHIFNSLYLQNLRTF